MDRDLWLSRARRIEAKYVLVVMDTWDGDIFPVYCNSKEYRDMKYKEYNKDDMLIVKDVIDVKEESGDDIKLMSIKKYIKKPVEIEALQWTGGNLFEMDQFINSQDDELCRQHGLNANDVWTTYKSIVERDGLFIETLEGTMYANIGDYIIKGVKGEFYPCKSNIFEMTYDLV